jgi:cellulose biosynthesis protein BcsQ
MKKIFIIVANNRGGVGKTIFALNMCVFMSRVKGYKVLAVDTDLNQLDLCKYLIEDSNKDIKSLIDADKVMDTKYERISLLVTNSWDRIRRLSGGYKCTIVDTHPNIYSPPQISADDILVIPFQGVFSMENALELIKGAKTRKIVGVLNQTPRNRYIGVKELRLARSVGIDLYPYIVAYSPLFRRMELERSCIYDIPKARQYFFSDLFEDICMYILRVGEVE